MIAVVFFKKKKFKNFFLKKECNSYRCLPLFFCHLKIYFFFYKIEVYLLRENATSTKNQ